MAPFKSSVLAVFSPTSLALYFKLLFKQYGTDYIAMMFSNYIGVRGAVKKFLDLNETAYYREAGYPASVNQVNQAISKLPGSIMGIGGLLSDLLPFGGYEKTSYMLLYTVLGSIALLCLILIPFDVSTHSATFPAIFFFIVNVQSAFNDLLMEGKSIDLMKDFPENRGSLVSFQFFCVTIGGLIPSFLVGFLADYLTSPRYIFWIALPFGIQPVIFLLTGCLIRDKASPSRNNRFDFAKAKKQFPVVFLNLEMFCAATGSFIMSVSTSSSSNFIYSITVSIILNVCSFICLPIVVAFINLYLFLGQALYLQIQPTLEYFYLADEICVPGGPAFDYTYLKTYIALMTQAGQLIGLWLYQAILTKMRYRQIFWISTILRIAASFFDVMIVMRWNVAVGIPDQYFYLFGHAIIYEITYMLDYLPFLLMISKICPKNIEVTLNGVLGGYTLYGGTISTFVGGYLADMLNIQTNLENGACNFNNIGWLVVIGNLILPAFLIPLAIILIPNKKVGLNIADETFENSKYLFSSIKFYKIYSSDTVKV